MDYKFEISHDERRGVFVTGKVVTAESNPSLDSYVSFIGNFDDLGNLGSLFNISSKYPDGIGLHYYRHPTGLTAVFAYSDSERASDDALSDFMRMTDLGAAVDMDENDAVRTVLEEKVRRVASVVVGI